MDEKPPPFVIVPTVEGFQALAGRVKQLEQRAAEPAAAPPPTLDPDPGVTERLQRHRDEIEALKSWCNDLARYLAAGSPQQTPPPKPEDYL
jgi:hypothetical protein